MTAPGKWHLIADLGGEIGQVWVDWREPVRHAIEGLHAARAEQQPDPPQTRAIVERWYWSHVEQVQACRERRCDH